eukprot:g72358.t1
MPVPERPRIWNPYMECPYCRTPTFSAKSYSEHLAFGNGGCYMQRVNWRADDPTVFGVYSPFWTTANIRQKLCKSLATCPGHFQLLWIHEN